MLQIVIEPELAQEIALLARRARKYYLGHVNMPIEYSQPITDLLNALAKAGLS